MDISNKQTRAFFAYVLFRMPFIFEFLKFVHVLSYENICSTKISGITVCIIIYCTL